MDISGTSPASRALLHMVAQLHYQKDFSQIEISKRLGVSTATVSRLLKRARETGIVRIEVLNPIEPEAMAERLATALHLKRVAVVESGPETGVLSTLAEPVGQMLREHGMGRGKVLAVSWGRTIWQLLQVGLPPLPGTLTVPAIGGMPEPAPHFQVNELIRLAASQLAGTPRFIHAPYLPSDKSRRSLLADPAVRESIQLWEHLDAALVGIGFPHSSGGEGRTGMTPSDAAIDNAAGDILLRYFDIEGRLMKWADQDRLLAISLDQLRRTPLVIGVAAAPAKAPGIIGVARSGVLDALVTNGITGSTILELVG